MRYLFLALILTGCTQAAITCPDKVSTLSYKGTNLLSAQPLTMSCTTDAAGGTLATISGVDLSALAAMVAKYMAANPAPIPVQQR